MSAESISENTDHLPPAVFLMGPTASGKTDLAVELVQRLPCEMISVDSALVYRGLDIGTAKPGPEILAQAPHRLIDICDPVERYSAARFRNDALAAMAEISVTGKLPLLTGGTMLYFRALEQGLSQLPEGDMALRRQLEEEASRQGWPALHQRLAGVDPVAASRIHPNDPQRIQRALEVYHLTGQPLSALQQEPRETLPFRPLKLVVAPKSRSELHARIALRFHRMLEEGFVDEVRQLLQRNDLTPDLPAMRSVGYRQIIPYLSGEYSREEMIERGIIATRQLAKRQYTWLRADKAAHWLDPEQPLQVQAIDLIEELTS